MIKSNQLKKEKEKKTRFFIISSYGRRYYIYNMTP